jgi:hypothetical protein
MAQARRSVPNGTARQFSANAVDEHAVEQAINAKMILNVADIDPSPACDVPNAFLCAMIFFRQPLESPRVP